MIEEKQLKQITKAYLSILEKYESRIPVLDIDDIKRLIGDVRLFWYRQKRNVQYVLSHIELSDEVYFLAGAVRVDIDNDGHIDFVLEGKYRIVNEPFLKLSSFYSGTSSEIDFDYANRYLKDSLIDTIKLLREYPGDFYVLPLEPYTNDDMTEYAETLIKCSDQLLLALFENKNASIKELVETYNSYEEIEDAMLPEISKMLTFDSLEDTKLTIREKCNKYLEEYASKLPLLNSLTEIQVFCMAASQFFMQALAIIFIMKCYKIRPFIRDDIAFNYFTIVTKKTSVMGDYSNIEYFYVYVPFILQKVIDFSGKGYNNAKEHYGNGKLVERVVQYCEEQDFESVSPNVIVNYATEIMEKGSSLVL